MNDMTNMNETTTDAKNVQPREFKEITLSGSWYLYRLKKFKFYFHKWYKIHKINHGDTRFIQQTGWHFVLAAHDLSYMDYIRAPIKTFGSRKRNQMEIGQVFLKPYDRLIVGQGIVIVYDLDDKRFRLYHKSFDSTGVLIPLNQYMEELEKKLDMDRNFMIHIRDNKNIAYEIRIMSNSCTVCHQIVHMGRSQKGIVAAHSLVNLLCMIHNADALYRKNKSEEE